MFVISKQTSYDLCFWEILVVWFVFLFSFRFFFFFFFVYLLLSRGRLFTNPTHPNNTRIPWTNNLIKHSFSAAIFSDLIARYTSTLEYDIFPPLSAYLSSDTKDRVLSAYFVYLRHMSAFLPKRQSRACFVYSLKSSPKSIADPTLRALPFAKYLFLFFIDVFHLIFFFLLSTLCH